MVNYAGSSASHYALTQIYLTLLGKNELDLMEGLSAEHYHIYPSLWSRSCGLPWW